jgi:H/ACA ribonucleoprotein complex subunit 3
MHLMYYTAPSGRRVYTLRKTAPDGSPTRSAHPGACRALAAAAGAMHIRRRCTARALRWRWCAGLALVPSFLVALIPSAARFSPDDKFSRHRVTIKKRYGLLLTQTPAPDQ